MLSDEQRKQVIRDVNRGMPHDGITPEELEYYQEIVALKDANPGVEIWLPNDITSLPDPSDFAEGIEHLKRRGIPVIAGPGAS